MKTEKTSEPTYQCAVKFVFFKASFLPWRVFGCKIISFIELSEFSEVQIAKTGINLFNYCQGVRSIAAHPAEPSLISA